MVRKLIKIIKIKCLSNLRKNYPKMLLKTNFPSRLLHKEMSWGKK